MQMDFPEKPSLLPPLVHLSSSKSVSPLSGEISSHQELRGAFFRLESALEGGDGVTVCSQGQSSTLLEGNKPAGCKKHSENPTNSSI